MYNSKIKMTTLGMSSSGKTTLTLRLVKDKFIQTESTIGGAFLTYVDDENQLHYEIWDTAGSERYASLMPMYYRGSDIILLVFDVSNVDSINQLIYYLNSISQHLKNKYRVIVVGNKTDLLRNDDYDNVDKYLRTVIEENNKDRIKISDYVYVSNKTGEGIGKLKNAIRNAGQEMIGIKRKESGMMLESDHTSSADQSKCSC